MSEAKKKLKKKMKICESHRTFKRKILTEVRESIDSGESVNQEKFKSFKSIASLQDKKINDMNNICDFTSAIKACIADLEIVLNLEKSQGKSQEVAIVLQSAGASLNNTQTGMHSSVSSIHNLKSEIAFQLSNDFADFPSSKDSDLLAFGCKKVCILFSNFFLYIKKNSLTNP